MVFDSVSSRAERAGKVCWKKFAEESWRIINANHYELHNVNFIRRNVSPHRKRTFLQVDSLSAFFVSLPVGSGSELQSTGQESESG